MIVFAGLIMSISYYYAMYYLNAARELKRMESNTKSPILELYGSVLVGIGTIRSFGKVEDYVDKMFSKVRHFVPQTSSHQMCIS